MVKTTTSMKTIQYMGSKRDLLGFLESSIEDYISNKIKKIDTFYDAFSGSGRVAYHFKDKYNIISSDKQYFTKVINDAYLNNHIKDSIIDPYIIELNNLPLSYFEETDKWFTVNYSTDWNEGVSVGSDGNPKIWMTKNAQKIDMIRTKLDDLDFLGDNKKDREIKSVLLLSLILGINKVSNVVGHQNGYLKKWCKNAQNDLVLENPNTFSIKNKEHINLVGDIYELLPQIESDLIYFDPPYGTNNENLSVATRYSSFYHLWNTIVKNDRPKIFGKAGKPIETKGWTPELEQNKKNVIIPKFKELVNKSNSPYVSFSYSNQGLLTKEDFFKLFEECGCIDIRCYEQSHKVNTQSKSAGKNVIFKIDVEGNLSQLEEGKINKSQKNISFKKNKDIISLIDTSISIKKDVEIQKELITVDCYEDNEGNLYFEKKGLWIVRDENTNNLIEYFFIMTKPILSKKDIINLLTKNINNIEENKIIYSSDLQNIYQLLNPKQTK